MAAFSCLGAHVAPGQESIVATGVISGNVFATCPGVPVFSSPFANGTAGWYIAGNVIDGVNGTITVLPMPTVSAAVGGDGSLVLPVRRR